MPELFALSATGDCVLQHAASAPTTSAPRRAVSARPGLSLVASGELARVDLAQSPLAAPAPAPAPDAPADADANGADDDNDEPRAPADARTLQRVLSRVLALATRAPRVDLPLCRSCAQARIAALVPQVCLVFVFMI